MAAFAQFERDNMIENTKAGLEAARARGRKGRRRPALDGRKLALAMTLRADPTLPIAEICKRFGVSKAAFYRYTKTGTS